MAVWLYAYGNNGIGNYNPDVIDAYLSILNSIEIEDPIPLYGITQIEHQNSNPTEPGWRLVHVTNQAAYFRNSLGYFDDEDGVMVMLYNDLVWLSGPFEIFSKYFIFQTEISNGGRIYFHHYFKRILKAFKSGFILYAHEWNLGDDDEHTLTYQELREWMPKLRTSTSIHNMSDSYYEAL